MAHHSRILFPDAFTLLVAIDYLAMIIIGRHGEHPWVDIRSDVHDAAPEVLKLTATSLSGVYPSRSD